MATKKKTGITAYQIELECYHNWCMGLVRSSRVGTDPFRPGTRNYEIRKQRLTILRAMESTLGLKGRDIAQMGEAIIQQNNLPKP